MNEQQLRRLRYTDRRKNRLDRREKRSWISRLWFFLVRHPMIRRSAVDRRQQGERRLDWIRCSPWVSTYMPGRHAE